MSIHDFIPLITAIVTSWPIAVLILAWLFRRRIKDIAEFKFGDKFSARFFGYGQHLSDFEPDAIGILPPRASKQLSEPDSTKWGNVADVFWLGGDLISTAQLTLRGAPKKRILYLLTQSYHHISELGLAEYPAGEELASLKSETESRSESALDRNWRSAFSERIYGVTRLMDLLLRERQPGYRPTPES